MGGIFFVPVAVIAALLWTGVNPNIARISPELIAVCLATLGYGFIGWIDDWQVLRKKSNKGISPKMKLLLQVGFAAAFCVWAMSTQSAGISAEITNISLPLGLTLPLGFLFWPLAGFVLVAESNATNLADGVDGLMGGAGAIALFGLGVLVAPTHPDLMVFCTALSGGCLGF